MSRLFTERVFRRALIAIALAGLILGVLAWVNGRQDMANWCWAAGTLPVVTGLLISMIRDLMAGRMGVDSVAFVSMSGALVLGQNLAGIVVAIMYAGGNLLEDIAVARAERDLRSLIDRAPRIAHRRTALAMEDIPIEQVAVGDDVLVRAGEVIPVDGLIRSQMAIIDEAAISGEPIPVSRRAGDVRGADHSMREIHSKSGHPPPQAKVPMPALCAWSLRHRRPNRLHPHGGPLCAAAAAHHPRGRRWRLVLLRRPYPWASRAGGSYTMPLILAAPVAFIAGIAQAAKREILIKGSGPLEALARTHTVMFDKTGTLTVGGARLVAIEVAPGQSADQVLRIAGSLEQASQHCCCGGDRRSRTWKRGSSLLFHPRCGRPWARV